MKRLLLALALAWSLSAFAQAPYQRNAFTTNAEPFFLSTFGLSPVMLRMNAGTNVDGLAHYSQALLATGTNTAFGGNLSGYTGTFSNSVVLPFGTASTLLSLSAGKNVTSLANGAGILTNDGSGGFGFTTNISQAITVNNFSTTNLTVFNTLTVSNIVTTNITVQNNLTVSNLYTVNGNHNSLIVTQALTLNSLKTNLLAVTSTGLITNANYGTGLTWTPSTLTLSATPVSAVNNLVVTQYVQMPWTTLTMSGSNVSTIDVSAGSAFKLTLTNNAFFGAPSNLPGTNLSQTIQVAIQQNSAGGWGVTFTNSAWSLTGSGASTNAVPTIQTNGNSVSIFTFVTSPFASTMLYGVTTPFAP